jgi:DNA phosphorothioation-dependent restriction protein DptG
LPRAERVERINEQRRVWKSFALSAVQSYMDALHVTLEELSTFIESEHRRVAFSPT